MFHYLAAAAVLALAAGNPAFAQGKANEGGKGKGPDHAAMDHGQGKSAKGRDDHRGQSDNPRKAKHTMERATAVRAADERIREVRGKDRVRVVERAVVRDGDRDDRRDGDWDRRGDWDRDGDWDGRGREFAAVPGCPPGLAKKDNGCLPPGLAKQDRDSNFGYEYRPTLFGIPLRTRADYVYYNGYLVPASGSGLSYIPLLGGALAVGQSWPRSYPTLQLADWQRDYYGFDDPDQYRYADNVVYRVDPETAAIEAVAALLTGNRFVVGQPMPTGYDVYNVPAAYQDRYYDNDESLYRYADGRVYEIDPTTMLIAAAIDLIV